MRSEFYLIGYEAGLKGDSIKHEFQFPEHIRDFEEGWFIGICEHLEKLLLIKKAKQLDLKK